MLHSSERMQSGMLSRRPDEESQQQDAAPAQEQSSGELPRWADPAEPILRRHNISMEQAGDLWQAYHDAPNSKALMHALIEVPVSNELKSELYDAKRNHDPAPTWLDRVDRVVDAIKRVAQLHSIPARDGRSIAEFGESHPNVMRVLVDAELKSKKDGTDSE